MVSRLIIEPALPICDAHHHLGARSYFLPDYLADLGSGHRIERTVAIECGAYYGPNGYVDETRALLAMADGGGKDRSVAAGIVARVNLCADDVEAAIMAHVEAAGGRLAGVRHIAAFDPDPAIPTNYAPAPPDLYRSDAFRRGFAKLAEAGLCFDSWQYHPQLPDLLSLARTFPNTTVVIDHVGGPLGIGPYAGRREDVFPVWRRAMAALAELPNTVVKLGGLGMPICGFAFEPSPSPAALAHAWRPYLESCIDLFGVQRAMFESNFPVDRHCCDYRTLWNAFKLITSGTSGEEKQGLFSATAQRVYGLW